MKIENPNKKLEETRQEKVGRIRQKIDSFYDKIGFEADAEEDGGKAKKRMELIAERNLELEKKIKQIGLNPDDYLLWHMLIGSSAHLGAVNRELDTPDGDIERQIDELMQ